MKDLDSIRFVLGGRNGHLTHRHHRLALGVEPGELIEGPDITALKGQIIAQLEVIPVQAAGNWLQQGGGVLADVIGLLAQAQAGQALAPAYLSCLLTGCSRNVLMMSGIKRAIARPDGYSRLVWASAFCVQGRKVGWQPCLLPGLVVQ